MRVFSLARLVGSVITPFGWAALAATVVALAVGYTLGWLEFAAAGLALAFLLVLSALFLIGRTRFTVELEVPVVRTVVGSPVTGRVVLGSEGRRPLWGARLEVQIGESAVPVQFGAGASSTTEFRIPADARGVVRVGPVRTVRGDPLGLFRRDALWTDTVDVFIHPATVAVPPTSNGFIRDLEGASTRDLTTDDISFHALREYRPGDDRRHIHWKSTARTGQLTVRQFEETRRSHVVIAFGLAETDFRGPDEFELGIGAVASIAVRALRDGRDVTVATSPPASGDDVDGVREPRLVSTRGRQRLLDELSTLDKGSSGVGLGLVSRLAADRVSGASLVFLVCGSTPTLRDLQSWSLRFPLGVEVVALVCSPEQKPGLQRFGELGVVTLGYLDDLRGSFAGGVS